MDYNSQCQLLSQQITDLLQFRGELRKKEKNLKIREAALCSQYQTANDGELASNLASFLPTDLLPANVGNVNRVAWNMYFPFSFDFGTAPLLTANTSQVRNVQISSEAAFLVLGFSVNYQDYSEASFLGPYQIDVRDNQSSRQLNDAPIPIQSLGRDSLPTEFPTPFMLMPNASIRMTATTWLTGDEELQTPPDTNGQFQIMMYGVRVRVEDARYVLSTVFDKS